MHSTSWRRAVCTALCAAVLSACGASAAPAASAAPQADAEPAATAEPTPPANPYQAPAMATSDFHQDAAIGTAAVGIDISCVNLGYVAVSASSDARLKFQVDCGEEKYNYDLPNDGTPASFPLQMGDGTYTFRVLENTSGTKYAALYETSTSVTLDDEFEPYLRPNEMVNYTADSACVAKAAELAQMAEDDAGVVAQVFQYVCDNITYDSAKASSVTDGYLPDPDATLAAGSGICYDYAALTAAMLRSQGIPTKLITGYVEPGEIYHAWNMIWLENAGWITVNFEAPAHSWERIDTTFAAGASADYTGDGTSYTDRYTY
ncbi:transglutaminase-like domain-containing protein [Gemmiger sp.]